MKNIRPFEIVLIGLFAVFAIGGIIALSMFKGGTDPESMIYGQRTIVWGSLDSNAFNSLFSTIQKEDEAFKVVDYVYVDERNFLSKLLNAIAEGNSPDLVVIPHTMLVQLRTKLVPLSYEEFPERDFRDRYVDGANIFMLSDGIYGIPFAVDPFMMYWNRDIFSSSGLAYPPTTWEELMNTTVPAITHTNEKFEITQSTVAFGEYENVSYPKEILAMLILQAGSNLVNESLRGYEIALQGASANNSALPPAIAALGYYNQFSSPRNASYTWNRSQPKDRSQFLSGRLALYFAPASERAKLEQENPNLDFDNAVVPQGSGSTVKRGYGNFYALAIPRASTNRTGAINTAFKIGSQDYAESLTSSLNSAPVHRSVIQGGSNDVHKRNVYTSALYAHGWLNPDPARTGELFKVLIEEVSSGRARIESAIGDTAVKLQILFNQ